MRGHTFVILAFFLLPGFVFGQGYRYHNKLTRFAVGIKSGVNISSMHLSADCYDIYKQYARIYGIIGGWFQYRPESVFSIRPEVSLLGRGAQMSCEDVKYKVSATFMNLRINAQLHFFIPRTTNSIYIVVAPAWNAVMGGSVFFSSEEFESLEMKLSSSNMHIHNFNLFFGFGYESSIYFQGRSLNIAGEIGYSVCMVNTFTEAEQTNDVTVLNNLLYSHPNTGSRTFNGIELSVRVGLPFGKRIRIKR